MTKSGGDLEADTAYLQGSVAFPLHSGLPDGEGQSQDIAGGTGPEDVRPLEQPVEGGSGDFFVARTVILHLYPGLGGPDSGIQGSEKYRKAWRSTVLRAAPRSSPVCRFDMDYKVR